MKQPPLTLMKSGRMVVVALAALVPLAVAAQAYNDSATPTYSGEERRQYQSETPGARGPVRSDMEGSQTYGSEGSLDKQGAQQQQEEMRGAKGPMRSETRQDMTDRQRAAGCLASGPVYTSPNAFYGESNPFYSEEGKAAFLGRGQYCAR